MNSGDGTSQLAQAVHLCASGHIAARHPIGGEFSPKDFKPGASSFYDSNGLGGTLFMLPAACVAVAHGQPDPTSLSQVGSVAKVGASMTFAFVGAFAAVFVLLTLCEIMSVRRSWWWSLAFVLSTGILAYIKGTWDVLPAATGVAALTWIVTRSRLDRDPPFRSVAWAAVAVGLAALARYTLLPFLTIAAVAALWPAIRRLSRRELMLVMLIFALIVIPNLAWNQLRTGEFWTPGEANPAFVGRPHLTMSYLLSVVGLFVGAQEGLLFFAPLCLLGYVVVLWMIAMARDRGAWTVGLLMAVLYVITVALVHEWEVFGWGPRYLVPLLPALFVVAVIGVERRIVPRVAGYALVIGGLLTQLPLVFANWHAVVAVVGRDSRAPDPIVGLWRSMLEGLASGHGFGGVTDARSLQVPDSWWWHAVANHSPHLTGPLLLLVIIGTVVTITGRRLRLQEH